MAECGISGHTHDPGVVLTHSAVATAASGLRAIPPAVAAARAKVWAASPPGVGCETTNEPLAAMLRPRNAESNDGDHHLELLDQALETDGSIRDGAWVVELTDLVDPSAWPEGTRLIMRRERPHPEVPRTDGSAEVVDQTTPNSILAAGSTTPAVGASHRGVPS